MADHALDGMARLGKVSESLSDNRSVFSHVGKISDGKQKTRVQPFFFYPWTKSISLKHGCKGSIRSSTPYVVPGEEPMTSLNYRKTI